MNRAPWTQGQVDRLNEYQQSGRMHPFTCGNNRSDDAHKKYAHEHPGEDLGQLIATTEGWVCPACDYTQDWAHDFMFRGAPPALRFMGGEG